MGAFAGARTEGVDGWPSGAGHREEAIKRLLRTWPLSHLLMVDAQEGYWGDGGCLAQTSPGCRVCLHVASLPCSPSGGERLTEVTDKTSDDPAQRPLQNRVAAPQCATLAKAALVDCQGTRGFIVISRIKIAVSGRQAFSLWLIKESEIASVAK